MSGGKALRARLAELEARIDALEAVPAPVEWKPTKVRDHSGDPVDVPGMWREHVADYAHGWDGDSWNGRGYL